MREARIETMKPLIRRLWQSSVQEGDDSGLAQSGISRGEENRLDFDSMLNEEPTGCSDRLYMEC